MRVFVAGATRAIGRQLVPRLVAAGHEVHGMTRSESKQAMLSELGAVPVVADALDPDQVAEVVARAGPEVIVHQLTALAGVMRYSERDAAPTNRLRTDGTECLLSAGRAVWVRRFVAQGVAGFGAYVRPPQRPRSGGVVAPRRGQRRAGRALPRRGAAADRRGRARHRRRPDHNDQLDRQSRQVDPPRASRRPRIATRVGEMNLGVRGSGSSQPSTRRSVFGPAYVVPTLTDQMCIEVAPPLVVLLTSGNVIDLTVLFGSTGTVVAYT